MNNLNLLEKENLATQRENILNLNPDLVFWVYELQENSEKQIILKNIENILTCYPNQLENLAWLKENSDIWILDLNSLRKWEKNFLTNPISKNISEKNLVLLSNWVIEVVKSDYIDKSWKIKQRNHFPTTLRDWGAIDINQRTSVAGRNVTSNLFEDLEREYAEESPFLSKKEDWNYYLFTPNNENKEQIISDLKNSVKLFLKNKYNLKRENENDLKSIKLIERSLKIKYEDLGKILEEIIENNRIDFFESKELLDFDGVSKDMKEIKMLDEKNKEISKWKFFVYFDEANNTIEYRWLREIEIPNWVRPTSRLFLESQNQWAKNIRLENLEKEKLVPTMKYFAEKVRKNLEN